MKPFSNALADKQCKIDQPNCRNHYKWKNREIKYKNNQANNVNIIKIIPINVNILTHLNKRNTVQQFHDITN